MRCGRPREAGAASSRAGIRSTSARRCSTSSLARTDVDPALIEDVIFGCVDQVGAQATNIARNAVLSSRLPETVPATTVDRQCGSSQQAVHFAAQAVMSGVHDVVIAGGVEVMSLVPIGGNAIAGHKAGFGAPYGQGMKSRYPGVKFSQFDGAELLAQRRGLGRERLDEFGFASHRKAAAATARALRARDPAARGDAEDGTPEPVDGRRGHPPDASLATMARAEAAERDRAPHRRHVEPDLRRRRRGADRERGRAARSA